MTKTTLIEAVAAKADLKKADADKAVNAEGRRIGEAQKRTGTASQGWKVIMINKRRKNA